MNKNKQNQGGFTMIELIIVVAIMGIIGAVLVPTFGNMATKARLTSDITTIKTLQKQFEIYKAEKGSYPTGFPTTGKDKVGAETIKVLVDAGYLDPKDLIEETSGTGTAVTGYKVKLQTGKTLKAENGRCYLAVGTTGEYKDLVDKLEDNDGNAGYVKGEAEN